MPTAQFRARGHSEVGHVESGPTDVSWGKTSEDGVEVQVNVTAVDLYSSQSTMEEDTGITRTSMRRSNTSSAPRITVSALRWASISASPTWISKSSNVVGTGLN